MGWRERTPAEGEIYEVTATFAGLPPLPVLPKPALGKGLLLPFTLRVPRPARGNPQAASLGAYRSVRPHPPAEGSLLLFLSVCIGVVTAGEIRSRAAQPCSFF